jgi:protein-tyrosine phosphatase
MYRSILIICDGNTSRSPMAEAMLKKMLPADVRVRSAGIAPFSHDNGLASLDAKLAMESDSFFDTFRTTALREHAHLLDESDLILTMTEAQKQRVIALDGTKEVYTLKEFAGDGGDILDPRVGDDESFMRCKEEIEHYLNRAIEKIV